MQQPGEGLGLRDRGESVSLFVFVLPEPLSSLQPPKFPPQVVQDAHRVRCEPGAVSAGS